MTTKRKMEKRDAYEGYTRLHFDGTPDVVVPMRCVNCHRPKQVAELSCPVCFPVTPKEGR